MLPFDARENNAAITYKGCRRYVDADKDLIADSWHPDDTPNVRFTIDDTVEKGKKPMLLVWFQMECRDCHHLSWIVWQGRLFDYSTCICHEPIIEEEPIMPVIARPAIEAIVIDNSVIPGELVESLKEHCFQYDTTKKDVIIEALRAFLNA